MADQYINPAYTRWVTMVKGDEEKLVHPGNVANHQRAGWKRADEAPAPELTEPVSVETPEEEPAGEEEPPAPEPAPVKPKKESKAKPKK